MVHIAMRAVARASGLKLGALQYHFRSREDLLRAMLEFIADRCRTQFQAYCETFEHRERLRIID